MVYSHVGLPDEAQRHVALALDLNPNNTIPRFRIGAYTALQCKFQDALAVLKTVPPDVSPFLVDRVKAEVYVQLGRPEKARAIIDGYLARHPDDEGGSLTSVGHCCWQRRERQKKQKRRSPVRSSSAGASAIFTTPRTTSPPRTPRCGGPTKRSIETAADDGFPCYPYFARDPNLDSLRGHTRFVDVMSLLHERWKPERRVLPVWSRWNRHDFRLPDAWRGARAANRRLGPDRVDVGATSVPPDGCSSLVAPAREMGQMIATAGRPALEL
jgi:hypothetical protein